MKKIAQPATAFKFLSPYELTYHLRDFTHYLSGGGYTALTINGYVGSISHFGTWLHEQGILIKTVDSQIITNFANHYCCCPGNRKAHAISKKYTERVRKFINFLACQGAIKTRASKNAHLKQNFLLGFWT